MKEEKIELKQGIKLHHIYNNRFKTNLLAVFLTMPLTRQTVTKETVISSILRRGTRNLKTQEEISKKLEEMYGASFDCGVEKMGDQHVIKFYLEALNEEFLPQKEDVLKEAFNLIVDIALNPYMEKVGFMEEYVRQEKENIKQMIEGKKDNKSRYALDRCMEEMYQGKNYGLYKYGYIEDLEELNAKNLYMYYQEMIQNCKIDIFVSGNIQRQEVVNLGTENKVLEELKPREEKIVENDMADSLEKEKVVIEELDVTQGKLVLGLTMQLASEEEKYDALVYNMILGGGANSKMFQNVREKASLAYTAGSNFIRPKNTIVVRAGIEIENYEKALQIIQVQLEDMKKGNFSEQDLADAKQAIQATIQFIPDEQDTQISYYLGQELAQKEVSLEEYSKKVSEVTKQKVMDVANHTKIHTIYFLKNK